MLYGIDCANSNCIHDTITGYRLRFRIRRSTHCWACRREGQSITLDDWQHMGRDAARYQSDWYMCRSCSQQWRHMFQMERNDLIFRPQQQESMYAQMTKLGVTEPGTGTFVIETPASLPYGYDCRILICTAEPLRRCAVYFRWRPLAGEMLTPDKAFQMDFRPEMTVAQRRAAAMRSLTEDQLRELMQQNVGGYLTSYSSIYCQHCGERQPLQAFSTTTLREVELGD